LLPVLRSAGPTRSTSTEPSPAADLLVETPQGGLRIEAPCRQLQAGSSRSGSRSRPRALPSSHSSIHLALIRTRPGVPQARPAWCGSTSTGSTPGSRVAPADRGRHSSSSRLSARQTPKGDARLDCLWRSRLSASRDLPRSLPAAPSCPRPGLAKAPPASARPRPSPMRGLRRSRRATRGSPCASAPPWRARAGRAQRARRLLPRLPPPWALGNRAVSRTQDLEVAAADRGETCELGNQLPVCPLRRLVGRHRLPSATVEAAGREPAALVAWLLRPAAEQINERALRRS
jgi:hypothetical protein